MKEGFIVYRSFIEALQELSDENFGRIFRAVCYYGLDGTEPELTGYEKMAFELMRPQIDANNKRYEDGKKGGRPRKKQEDENKKTSGYEDEKPVVIENKNQWFSETETSGFEKQKPVVINSETSGFENNENIKTSGLENKNQWLSNEKPKVKDKVKDKVKVKDNVNVNVNVKDDTPEGANMIHDDLQQRIVSELNHNEPIPHYYFKHLDKWVDDYGADFVADAINGLTDESKSLTGLMIEVTARARKGTH